MRKGLTMARNLNNGDMSELEREFELEMEEDEELGDEGELEEQLEEELEAEPSDEELEDAEVSESNYGERFYELSQRQFESESEVDEAVNKLLNEMEREYFFGIGKLAKKIKRGVAGGVRRLGRSKIFRSALGVANKLGLNHPALQALKSITQLARGDFKGIAAALAKAGLGSAIPGGGVLLPTALQALGFKETEYPEENREAWNRFDRFLREAYDHLSENLTERIDEPLEVRRLTTNAIQAGLRRLPQPSAPRPYRQGPYRQTRVITLGRGERVVIKSS
jgi:hypothetical protein